LAGIPIEKEQPHHNIPTYEHIRLSEDER